MARFFYVNHETKPQPGAVLLMVAVTLLEIVFGILLAWLGANELPSTSVLEWGALVMEALLTNELLGWKQRR